jgi:hypothetical protein
MTRENISGITPGRSLAIDTLNRVAKRSKAVGGTYAIGPPRTHISILPEPQNVLSSEDEDDVPSCEHDISKLMKDKTPTRASKRQASAKKAKKSKETVISEEGDDMVGIGHATPPLTDRDGSAEATQPVSQSL